MGDDAEYYIEQQEEEARFKQANTRHWTATVNPFYAGQTELDMRMKYGVGGP